MKTARPTTDAVLRERLRKINSERQILIERERALRAVSLDQIEREERAAADLLAERRLVALVVSGLIPLAASAPNVVG